MSRPTLELVMIVRNGGAGLARCLKSVLPVVDGILIGDTGSTDDSVSIARALGAYVFDVPWENDFSRARNAVLSVARADWVLSMDADEMLDPDGASLIPSLLAQSEIDAFEVWRWNYVRSLNSRSGGLMAEPNPYRLQESRPYPAYTRYLNTLLFRRNPGVYFENPVHETVAKRVVAMGLKAAGAPFVIHHFGFVEDAEQVRKDKSEFYQQLGLQKVHDNPQDDWAHYELGLGELELHHNPAAALACFEWARGLNPANENAWIYAGICLTRLGRLPEALDRLRHAVTLGVRSSLLSEAIGDVFFHQGDACQAAHWYEQVGATGTPSALVDCKRGACQVRLDDVAAGMQRIEAAVAREPEAGELYEIWAAAAVQAGDAVTAARAATQRLTVGTAPAGSFLIAAVFVVHLGHWDRALEILLDGLKVYPGDPMLEMEAETAQKKVEELNLTR
jgi:glycosyltransferase involved in cell wall biosynthesis